MILAQIQQITTSNNLIVSAAQLAAGLGKSFGIIVITNSAETEKASRNELHLKLSKLDLKADHLFFLPENSLNLLEICESNEVSFLLVQLLHTSGKIIQQKLLACRELRIPYIFFKSDFSIINYSRVLVPVSFLIEEVEKAQFAAAFGRYFGTEIVLLQAKDYGSKAAKNVEKISKVLDTFNLHFTVEPGNKDSFKIEFDAVQRSANKEFGLIIASSSREYGLDDVIFGPKELHLLKRTKVPLVLINPRADLYVLCD